MIRILGISRAPLFSPNSVLRDTAILQSVAKCLSKNHGCDIRLIDERFLIPADLENIEGIFSMGRAKETLEILAEAEAKGLYMPNSAASLLTLNRRKLHTFYLKIYLPFHTPAGLKETTVVPNTQTMCNSFLFPKNYQKLWTCSK